MNHEAAPSPPPVEPAIETAPKMKKLPFKQRAMRQIRRLIIMYICWCVLLFFGQRWVIFPDYVTPEPGPEEKYDNSTVVLTRDIGDGEKVIAWYIPSPSARKGVPSPLVVYFHGNAEIIDTQPFPIEMYRNLNCSILLPEYRSYGRSKGTPSEKNIVDDAIYFHDEILKRPEVDHGRVFFHGRSLGAAVAAQLAVHRTPRLLILGSPFTSIRPFARRILAPTFLLRSTFDTDRVLPDFKFPVLIQHGVDDDIVPISHGRKLKELAKDCTYVEYQCMHNDFPGDNNAEQYFSDVRAFLEKNVIVRNSRDEGSRPTVRRL